MTQRTHILLLAACLGLFLKPGVVAAQVAVAPTALFLSDQERFGALYVANQSATPQEVTIGFRFGYPASDSAGTVFVQFDDTTAAERFSIAPYVRAFPQRFILPPGESQVVRLTARPRQDADTDWMWTRVITTSTPQVEFRDTTDTGIRAQVVFRLQQVTALFYRSGESNPTVDISNVTARADSNQVVLLADVNKNGDGPFLGTAISKIKHRNGREIAERRTPIAIYVSERRRFTVTLPNDMPSVEGLTAELTISPNRPDIPTQYLATISPVSRSASVRP